MTRVDDAYSRRAAEYIDLLGSVDAMHPSDRQLIDSWSDMVEGRAIDAGCGPGHWTAHLARRGAEIHGIDLVPAFIEHARAEYPDVRFDVGSIDDLVDDDGSLGGVLSWFSTIHHHPSGIAVPLDEFARVLRPGGALLVGFFVGATVEEFDHAVAPAYRWPCADLESLLQAHGFDVLETHTRTGRGHRPVGAVLCRRSAIST